MKFPDSPATGKIHGKAFQLDRAVFNGTVSTLTLRQGEDFFPDRALTIFLFLEEGESPEGKSFEISPEGPGAGKPHIHMKWREAGKDVPETKIMMKNYAMRLEFGQARDGAFPGKLYLCLPDEEKSVVAGTFTAKPK